MPKKTTDVSWDYSNLAGTYDKRANYSVNAIKNVASHIGCAPWKPVADIGAGTAKLSVQLANLGLTVHCVEPNDNMRSYGIKNTKNLSVNWYKGTAESTVLADTSVYATFFGSSFNVVDHNATLKECMRILVPNGWLVCMWNHRELDDPIQRRIENVIKYNIKEYDYGSRRTDPTQIIIDSGLFGEVKHAEDTFAVRMSRQDIIDAWKSNATLARQAKESLDFIIKEIEKELTEENIVVPYTTRIWFSQMSVDKNDLKSELYKMKQ